MKSDNLNHEEKVLVLGAGQLGAAVLDALVPAVIQRQGTVSVIVSPSTLPVATWRRWLVSLADSPP